IALILLIFLVGCGAIDKPIDADTEGFFNHYFVYNFSVLIKKLASILNGNYGLSIIIITLIIRLAVMPFMLKQTRHNLEMQDKMKDLKPEMEEIQNKYKGAKDRESQMQMQQEMMQLYQKHNFNPLAPFAGCLPLLIQIPILIAFYWAIRRTPEIAEHQFVWFDLGQNALLLPINAVAIYFVQCDVTQLGIDPTQKKQVANWGPLWPVMIGIVSLDAPAALPLYWTVGGLFFIGQTMISKKI